MILQRCPALFIVLYTWYGLSSQPSHASFLHYSTDQGLSNDHITCITKDNLGFLWIGTVNGLNRFDGRSFKTFQHEPGDKNSVPENQIIHFALAPDGWLWIATTGGLCKLDPVWLDIKRIPLPENADTVHNDAVTMIAFDAGGKVWTTGEQAIYRINPGTDTVDYFFSTEESVLGWYGMLIDKEQRVWLMKDVLRRFDPVTENITQFNVKALSLVQDTEGQIWAGTWSDGVWKYQADSDDFSVLPKTRTLAMMVLPDESEGRQFLWIGGGQSGLALYYPDIDQFIEFKHDPQDPYTHNNYLVKKFFKDTSSGDVWLGTEVGLEHYAPATIRFGRAMIPAEKDMGQFSLVSGVVHDRTDHSGQRYFIALWGTGLFDWNKTTGKFTRIHSTESKMTGPANFSLFQDSRGFVWVCMKNGIGRYHPVTSAFRDYENFFKYPERNNLFWCGIEDRNGNLWFGSNKEGLFRYNPDADRIEQAYYREEFAASDGSLNVVGISEDNSGRLWLACGNSGLICFDPATGTSDQFFFTGHKISSVCNAVEAGSNGLLYAGFYDAFVEMDADGKLLRSFTQQNGLRSNRLSFMVEDRQGKIWFNSVYLLHCFDPVTGTFSYYGKADGLFSNIMTDALNISPSGEIFVGFQNAFNFFNPERLRRNLQPPPIAVTAIKVMNKERQVIAGSAVPSVRGMLSSRIASFDHDTILRLRPGEDFFEVEFAALSYNQQERNRYAYRLEGFNKDWIYTERPVATFTNLDGGDYVLHMKAANNDGIWNEAGATLRIEVYPPFYETRWFPVLVALALSGAGAGLLWFRRQQRKRLEKFRESLARDLHDEMGSTLSSIRFFSEFANQQIGSDKPHVRPILQRISDSATNLSESMQDIVWAMKTQHDELEDMAAHMVEFGLRLLEARNVAFRTYVSDDLSGKQLRPEVRRNIYLIFKEAIHNAAKYADATVVEFHFALKKGVLLMQIRDNGKGFDSGNAVTDGGGNGLQNMRKRAEDIGGNLDIISDPAAGTRIELRVHV